MFDTTLDLFAYNDSTDDKDHMIDTIGETYWEAMQNCCNDGREFDAISIYEEWVVDGIDPQDGGTEFIFVPDFTRETEEN